jgi:G:T/U-mismatch repair DNA glycosylase
MGLTNLVDRPSRMGNELSDAECRAAAPILTAKIKKYHPRFVCFVGKQAWDMYAGVGLGLQTAWVSWDDTPEDDELLFGADLEDKAYPIQRRMNEQGYRLAPFLETGPSAEKLDGQLMAEGAPSPYVKREDGELVGIKAELREEEDIDRKEDVKMEDAEQDIKPVKEELDDKILIKKELNDDDDEQNRLYVKKEQDDKNAIKTELYHASTSSSSRRLATPRYRGGVRGSRMFVMPSTSGRVTQYRKEDKLAYFQQLGELVRRDRQIRGVKAPWEQ